MTTRTVPFAERATFNDRSSTEPDAAAAIVAPDGKPARRSKSAKCPQCGAGPDKRVTSGLGEMKQVTCEACAYEFPPERAS